MTIMLVVFACCLFYGCGGGGGGSGSGSGTGVVTTLSLSKKNPEKNYMATRLSPNDNVFIITALDASIPMDLGDDIPLPIGNGEYIVVSDKLE